MKKYTLLLLFIFLTINLLAQKKRYHLDSKIEEASGLYIQNTDTYWWLNDSGDGPNLYLTDAQGQLKETLKIPTAKNVDWEDLAVDDKGNLYIGDFGNNRNNRKDLVIYKYNIASKSVEKIPFSYPDQKAFPPEAKDMNFDMEGFFWYENELHLFSKNKVGRGDYVTKHYTLSDEAGEQVAILLEQIHLPKRVITAAAISPDKKTIAFMTYDYGRFLKYIPWGKTTIYTIKNWQGKRFLKGELKKQKITTFLTPAQYEAIDFLDNETLVIGSEQIFYAKQRAKRVRVK